MRILFLTHVLPYPLNGGAKIRAYYMIRYLARCHDITLVSFVREDDRIEDVEHLSQICDEVHVVPIARSRGRDINSLLSGVMTREPAVIARDRSRPMKRLLDDIVNDKTYDAIHADQTSMAQYALYAQSATGGDRRPTTVLDQHNALHLVVSRQAVHESGWRRPMWRQEARQLARYEAGVCRRFDHILTVSDNDRKALLSLYSPREAAKLAVRFSVLPICVDPEFPDELAPLAQGHHILHVGTMFWPPNVEGTLWFIQDVMPKIVARVPESQFTVVGKSPPERVRQAAGPNSPVYGHVDVTGYIADVSELVKRSRVFVVPLKAGGGMRVKILDAWQWGIPVVSTTIGAEGIRVVDDENILLADSAEEFAQAVVRVLHEPGLAERLRSGGRRTVESHYDWRRQYGLLDQIYANGAL